MKLVRFLIKEVLLNGILFVLAGTVILSLLYLVSTNADVAAYLDALKTFGMILIGRGGERAIGHTSGDIILAGAVETLPLALLSLAFLVFFTLVGAAYATTSHYMAVNFGKKTNERIEKCLYFLFSVFAAIPLFVGFWLMYVIWGNNGAMLPLIALGTILFGGLTWDALNFLKADMLGQVGQVHGILFSTLGDHKLGRLLPLSGTYSGYLFSSSLPRFLPYLAGKISAIIGSVTIAEIAFDLPGLGKNLIDAMVQTNTNLLITSVFVLLIINAIVSFIVKLIMFLVYPRVYEGA